MGSKKKFIKEFIDNHRKTIKIVLFIIVISFIPFMVIINTPWAGSMRRQIQVQNEGRAQVKEWLAEHRKGAKLLSVKADKERGKKYKVYDLVRGTFSFDGKKYNYIYNLSGGEFYTDEREELIRECAIKDLKLNELVKDAKLDKMKLTYPIKFDTNCYLVEENGEETISECRYYEIYVSNMSRGDATDEEVMEDIGYFAVDLEYTCEVVDIHNMDFELLRVVEPRITISDAYGGSISCNFRHQYEANKTWRVWIDVSPVCFYKYDDNLMFGYHEDNAYEYYYSTKEVLEVPDWAMKKEKEGVQEGFQVTYSEDGKSFEAKSNDDIFSGVKVYVKDIPEGIEKVSVNGSQFGKAQSFNFVQMSNGWYQIQGEKGEYTNFYLSEGWYSFVFE